MCREERASPLLSRMPHQNGIRVDCRTLPPLLFRTEPEDGKVQVGRGGRGIAGAADIADHLALAHSHTFAQARRVMVEMRVIVTPGACKIELVDGDSAQPAVKQLGYR